MKNIKLETKCNVRFLCLELNYSGVAVEGLHSKFPQNKAVLFLFFCISTKILVEEKASRGTDGENQ